MQAESPANPPPITITVLDLVEGVSIRDTVEHPRKRTNSLRKMICW